MKSEQCVECNLMGTVFCWSCNEWRCTTHAFDHSRPEPGDSLDTQKDWEARQLIPAFFSGGIVRQAYPLPDGFPS